MAVPLLAIAIGWPLLLGVDAILRRRRGEARERFRWAPLLAILAAALTGTLFAWFVFGFVARSNRLFDSGEIFFGMPNALAALSWMPVMHAGLAAVLTLALPFAWRQGWWRLPRRILFSVLVVGFLLQVGFHVAFNYLPARW